ncbi:MAG: ATP-binding protein [Acholeplasmatales bacterium]|nr:ATP-binding protein [Acholeplasmatales bacterium]
MDFYGRIEEQKAINYILEQDRFSSGIIYGRRRLGKTELLKHCFLNSNKKFIIYQCNQENEKSNINDLTKLIKESLNIKNISFDTFIDAVEYLFEYGIDNELLFAIDEYPYIRKIIDGLDSKLQRIIDSYQNKTKIKFFLLGSSISTMEDVQSDKNPLYRRFNLSLLLKEMDYYDSANFYKDFSNEDKVKLYAAFGGVPFYNKQIDSNLSVKENIINLLSGQFSHLLDDITTNMKEELNKINNAYTVFSSIALGAFHYSDILSKSGINTSSSLYDTLEVLEKMDLIEYVCPINDKNNKKKSGYVLTDNAIYFYYRYIYHNLSIKNIMSNNAFYDNYIKEDFLSVVVPKVFEKISKQYLIRLNKLDRLEPIIEDIGTYWYDDPKAKKNGQFDLVTKSKDGYDFYEVKFTSKPIDDTVVNEELYQLSNANIKYNNLGFISKSGFDITNNANYNLISIDEIYNIK